MKKTNKIHISIWIQAVAIILVGVLLSVIALLIINDRKTERYMVTFAYLDGTVIDTKTVKEGEGVYPPEFSCEGVFQGWSGRINVVETDIEVHPLVHKIAEENLFYFNAEYVREGAECKIDLYVGGEVSVSSGTITIFYDTEVLKFVKPLNALQCDVCEDKKGEITITFDSESELITETRLAQLVFKTLKKNAFCTELLVSAENVKSIIGEREKTANYATINNKIYFLQEVS